MLSFQILMKSRSPPVVHRCLCELDSGFLQLRCHWIRRCAPTPNVGIGKSPRNIFHSVSVKRKKRKGKWVDESFCYQKIVYAEHILPYLVG